MTSSAWVLAGVVLAVLVAAVLALAAWAQRRQRALPDPAWRAQTPVQKYAGYEQAKGVAGRARSRRMSTRGMPYPAKRPQPGAARPSRQAGQPSRDSCVIAPPSGCPCSAPRRRRTARGRWSGGSRARSTPSCAPAAT